MGKYLNAYPFTEGYKFQAETSLGKIDVIHWGDTLVVFGGDPASGAAPEFLVNRIPVSFRGDICQYQEGQYNPHGKNWQIKYFSARRRDKFEDATDAQCRKIQEALLEWIDAFMETKEGKAAHLRGLVAHHASRLHSIAGKLDDIEKEQFRLMGELDHHKNLRNQGQEALQAMYFPIEEVLATDPGEPND